MYNNKMYNNTSSVKKSTMFTFILRQRIAAPKIPTVVIPSEAVTVMGPMVMGPVGTVSLLVIATIGDQVAANGTTNTTITGEVAARFAKVATILKIVNVATTKTPIITKHRRLVAQIIAIRINKTIQDLLRNQIAAATILKKAKMAIQQHEKTTTLAAIKAMQLKKRIHQDWLP